MTDEEQDQGSEQPVQPTEPSEVVFRGHRVTRQSVESILQETGDVSQLHKATSFYVLQADGSRIGAKEVIYAVTGGAEHWGNEAAQALLKLGFCVHVRRRADVHSKPPYAKFAQLGLLLFDEDEAALRQALASVEMAADPAPQTEPADNPEPVGGLPLQTTGSAQGEVPHAEQSPEPAGDPGPCPRRPVRGDRLAQDSEKANAVKGLYAYRCQLCNRRLRLNTGPYAEGAHIWPLGDDGPDVETNILCLCPNHHVLFDGGAFSIQDDMTLIGRTGKHRELRIVPAHKINPEYLRRHRRRFGFQVD